MKAYQIWSNLNGNNCPSAKKFDLEDMIRTNYVKPMFNRFKGEAGVYISEYEAVTTYFEDIGYLRNNDEHETFKKNLIEDLNELNTTGHLSPEHLEEKLKDTRFTKYFNVPKAGVNQDDQYDKNQAFKMFLIYCYIRPFYSEESKSEEDFIKTIAEALQSNDKDETNSMIRGFSLIFSFAALKEFRNTRPDLLERGLLHMHSTLLNIKPGLLGEITYQNLYSDEETINNQRDFLADIARDESIKQSTRELSVKLILLLGNARASGEDYLVAYNIIKECQLNTSIRNELSISALLDNDVSTSASSTEKEFKKIEDSSKEVQILTGFAPDISYYSRSGLTFDENYAYITN